MGPPTKSPGRDLTLERRIFADVVTGSQSSLCIFSPKQNQQMEMNVYLLLAFSSHRVHFHASRTQSGTEGSIIDMGVVCPKH